MKGTSGGKHLTAREWDALVATDPVLQFIAHVEKAAIEHPLWDTNYALALYKAFGDEARRVTFEGHGVSSIELEVPKPPRAVTIEPSCEETEQKAAESAGRVAGFDSTGVISRMYLRRNVYLFENGIGVGVHGWVYEQGGPDWGTIISNELARRLWDEGEANNFEDWVRIK